MLVSEGHDVLVVDDLSGGYKQNVNVEAEFHQVCVEDLRPEMLEGVDIVYHLAAHAAEGLSLFVPYHNAQKNYMAFMRLMTACVSHSVKVFVFTSSMAVYGGQSTVPFDETAPPAPVDPYGVAKASIERLLSIYAREFGISTVIIRPHNVYGPRQNMADPYRNVIGIFINRLLHGKPPIIYGDGLQRRAFSYVLDVAPHVVRAAFSPNCYGQTINLGSATPWTIADVAQIVIDEFGSTLRPLHVTARPCEVQEAFCTSEKSRALLHFEEAWALRDGIKAMIQWARTSGPQTFRYLQPDAYEVKKRMPETWSRQLM